MFEERKKNYQSDIDKFLTNFDKGSTPVSKSQIKEIEKFDNIKKLRD
jgi:hypothetical protein